MKRGGSFWAPRMERLSALKRSETLQVWWNIKIKFLAPRQGHYEFDLFVKSNAYMDWTKRQRGVETLDASVLPEYKVHPDDAELDDEPTLFEEMLNANIERDSDSDDDSDSDKEDDGPSRRRPRSESSCERHDKEMMTMIRTMTMILRKSSCRLGTISDEWEVA